MSRCRCSPSPPHTAGVFGPWSAGSERCRLSPGQCSSVGKFQASLVGFISVLLCLTNKHKASLSVRNGE